MNVLFVCRFNKVRSKLAAAFFNKYADKHSAKSAGIVKGSAVDDKMKSIAKRHGVSVGGVSKSITVPLLRWHDIMVIVADDIPRSLFAKEEKKYGKALYHWKIKDKAEASAKESDRMAKEIEKQVKRLISRIMRSAPK